MKKALIREMVEQHGHEWVQETLTTICWDIADDKRKQKELEKYVWGQKWLNVVVVDRQLVIVLGGIN